MGTIIGTIIGLAFYFLPISLLYICVIVASRRTDKRVSIYFIYLGVQLGSLFLAWLVFSVLAFGLAVSGGTYDLFFLIMLSPQIIMPILVAVTFITRLPKVKNAKCNDENIAETNNAKKISLADIYAKIWQ